MKTTLIAILIAGTLPLATTGWGDIYRHDDGGETVSFTDTPSDGRYRLILREQRAKGTLSLSERSRQSAQKASGTADRQLAASSAPSGILPISGVITSTTGLRSDPFNGRLTHHNGMDIAAPTGTPVKPVAPGTVIFSGWRGGYGNTVIVEHDDGMLSVYAHHANNQVTEGASVDRSTVIALSGSTGRSTGPHLHFEAWRNGENITATFHPAATGEKPRLTVASAPVKRFLQPDGTILFTNLR